MNSDLSFSSFSSDFSSDSSFSDSSNMKETQMVLFENKKLELFHAPKINNRDLLIVSLLEYICTLHKSDERLFYLLCEYLVQNGIITDPEMIEMEKSHQRLVCQKIITSILNPPTPEVDYSVEYPIERISSFSNDRYYTDFIEVEKIGKGGFGTVFKAYNKLDSGIYAIKKINITKLADQSNNYHLDEVKYLAKLSHPNIVRYYGTWIDCRLNQNLVELILYIQMEFCDSSLDIYLIDRNYSGLTTDFTREQNIFHQIIKGLKYIHKNDIIHGDLSPSNIFLSNDIVKIGDFGLAKQSNCNDVIKTRSYGNQLYLAPERSQHFCSPKSDIYSLGIIFLELFMIFKTNMEKMITLETIRKGQYTNLTLSSHDLNLLKSMTELDYKKRISIDEIKYIV